MIKKDIRDRLTGFILDHHRAISLFFILIVILGIYSVFNLHIDFMPERAEHVVTIITEYPDTETNGIIDLITKPLERAIKNVKGVKDIYSFSSSGRSKIFCHFNPHENIDEFIVRLSDRIYQVAEGFPNEVHHPMVFRYNTNDSPLMMVSIQQKHSDSDNLVNDGDVLNNLIKNRLKLELLSIEGVANVQISGLDSYENLIKINPEALNNLKVNYLNLLQYLLNNNYNSPPGEFLFGDKKFPVRLSGKYRSVIEMKKGKVKLDKSLIYSRDLLDVVRVKRPSQRFSMVNNRTTVVLSIYKKSDSSVIEIDRRVTKCLNAYSHELLWQKLYSEAHELKNLLDRITISLAISFILLAGFLIFIYRKTPVFVILLFISLIISCFGSLLTIYLFGLDLNIISLAGVIIGAGFTLIYGIIFLEKLKNGCCKNERYHTEESFGIEDRSKEETSISILIRAIENAFNRSARPIFSTTFVVTIVFLPIFFVNKSFDDIIWIIPYKDFALTISATLWWSIMVYFLFVPSFLILIARRKNLIFKITSLKRKSESNFRNKEKNIIQEKFPLLLQSSLEKLIYFWSRVIEYRPRNNVKKIYKNSPGVNCSIRRKDIGQKIIEQRNFRKKVCNLFIMKRRLLLVLYLMLSLFFLYLFYQTDYIEVTPQERNYREFYYQFNAGFTHDYKVNTTKYIVRKILLPDYEPLGKTYKIGASKRKDQRFLVTSLEGDRISFRFFDFNDDFLKKTKQTIIHNFRVKPVNSLNIEKKIIRKDGFFYSSLNKDTNNGIDRVSSLRVIIFGYDVKSVNRLADSSSEIISSVHGVVQILKGYREGIEELSIVPDIAKLYFYNLDNLSAERFLRYLFYKPVIFKFYNGESLEDVRASVDTDDWVQKIDNVKEYIQDLKLPIRTGDSFIRVSDFAEVYSGKAPSEITRKNGRPYIALDVRYTGNNKNDMVSNIRRIMAKQPFKFGEYFVIDKEALAGRNIRLAVLLSLLLSIFLTWIVMSIVLKSFMFSSLSILPLPVAIGGLIMFLKIFDFSNSISSVISALTLSGLSIIFNLLIMEALFFNYFSEPSLLKKETTLQLQKIESGSEEEFINSLIIILISFVAVLSLLMPIYCFVGINHFYRVLSGTVLFTLFIIILFILAIFLLLCILIKSRVLYKS